MSKRERDKNGGENDEQAESSRVGQQNDEHKHCDAHKPADGRLNAENCAALRLEYAHLHKLRNRQIGNPKAAARKRDGNKKYERRNERMLAAVGGERNADCAPVDIADCCRS